MVSHLNKLCWVRLELSLAPLFQTTLQAAMFWQRVELQKESSLGKVCGEGNRLDGVSFLQTTILAFAVRCFEEHALVKGGLGTLLEEDPTKFQERERSVVWSLTGDCC